MPQLRVLQMLLVVAAAAALATGCGSGPGVPVPAPTAPTVAPGTPVQADTLAAGTAATPAKGATPPSSESDAVAFFRDQEAACRAHADRVGNPVVEPDRFATAMLVRDLGGGAHLVEDGQGTRLVVRPGDGIVLPESGEDTDLMPPPYGFGCPEDVFRGTAD